MNKYKTQIKAIFSIFGDYFDPRELTNLLNIQPTEAWRKGDKVRPFKNLINKRNTALTKNETAWEYSTSFVETLDLEEVLEILRKKLESKSEKITKFVSENNLYIKIFIIAEIVGVESPSFYINKDIIKFCNLLNAEIDFDLYLIENE